MESLGKELDLAGKVVHQGITVLGNKGSTDQHSYIQQLRDGRENFFVIFIEVLKDRTGISMEFEKSVTSGDYLHGFLHGTRQALYENGRESISLTMKDSSAFSVGALIALFERTVGFYASLVNVNAYHQPGVEAGKKAASSIIALVAKASDLLKTGKGKPMTASEIAEGIGASDEVENVYKICERLAANTDRGVTKTDGSSPSKNRYASNR